MRIPSVVIRCSSTRPKETSECANSPALKIGFQNFPMDRFGVQKPALKAQARTPVIPSVVAQEEVDENTLVEQRQYWLGAQLHSLEGSEFSAFGVSQQDLGVQLADVPHDSPAAKAGLQTNDVVQQVKGVKVSDTQGLFAALIASGPAAMQICLVRNQQTTDVTLADVPYVLTETANTAGAFKLLVLQPTASSAITSRPSRETTRSPPDG